MTLPKDPIKKAQKGKPRSIDSRRKQSKTMKESWTPERRKAFSESRIGQKHSEETIQRMKATALTINKSFPQSPQSRMKISIGNTGKTKEQNRNKDMSIHHVYTEKLACCENEIEEKDMLRKRFPPEIAKFGNQTFSPDEIKHIRMVVPLCMSHHSSVNTRKECEFPYGDTDYRKYFTELIEKKYDGKPFYTKEEMKLLGGINRERG